MYKSRLFLLLYILFVVSCQKENQEKDTISESISVNFFPVEYDSSMAYAPIIDYLKANDLTNVLVKKLAMECGQPLWENVIYANDKSPSLNLDQSISTGQNLGSYLILPFIQDSLIKSLLICEVSKERKVLKAKLINSKDYKKWSFKKAAGRMDTHELTALLFIENYRILGLRNFILNDNRILSNESGFIATKKRYFFLERIRYGRSDQDISVSKDDTEIMNSICMYGWGQCHGDLVGVAPGEPSPGVCPYSICIEWTQIIRDEYLPDPINYNGSNQAPQSDLFSSGGGGQNANIILSFSDYAQPPYIWSFSGDDGSTFNDLNPTLEPNFVFDPTDNYETKYPRFTNMVKNLKSFVKNNNTVMNALQRYSGFTKEQILDRLTFGQGPTIKVIEMEGRFGFFNKTISDKTIFIRASYVRGLEQSFLQGTQEATAFLLAVTILHEFVHLSTTSNNISEGVYDFGYGFERDAFNVIVDDDNAGNVVIKFSKYF